MRLPNPWGIDLTMLTSPQSEPHLGGNKYHKLTGYLAQARGAGLKALITMAGAHSNHLRAFAALARREDFKAIALIRGEELGDAVRQSEEIGFALAQGVECHFVNRAVYRVLRSADARQRQELFPAVDFASALFIPEGGKGATALSGVMDWARAAVDFDEIWLPVATGTTAAGFLAGTRSPRVLGVQVLRNAPEIMETLESLVPGEIRRMRLIDTATRFRFGRHSEELARLADEFSTQWKLDIDREYMARAIFALGAAMQSLPAPGRVLLVQTYNS